MSDSKPSPFQAMKPYLTKVPWRSPEVKLHGSLAHAQAAISVKTQTWGRGAHEDMELWEWLEGDWVLKHEVKAGTLKDDLPWKHEGKVKR